MKTKLILATLLALTGFHTKLAAQKLYGANGMNALLHFHTGTNAITQVSAFASIQFSGQTGKLVHLGNGMFIGQTTQSPNGYGALYKTDTTGTAPLMLYDFNNNNWPQSSFVLAGNGKLYVLARTGTANESAIYSFDPETNAYDQVYEIPGNAQSSVLGGMVSASDGMLYGVTYRGGTDNAGRIFRFDPNTNAFTSLYEFAGLNGVNPNAAMVQGADGKLYGSTAYGGANNHGVLFSYTISSNTYTKLFDFVQSTGESPMAPLYQASNGKFYGTTMSGGAYYQGVLFSFDPATNIYTDLHDFFAGDGYGPRTYPVEGNDGKLYGTTNQGGANFRGSVYSFDMTTSVFTKLLDGDDTNAGNFTSPFFSFDSPAAGLSEKAKAIELEIFPNPVSDELHIKAENKELNYTICDVSGKMVQNGKTQQKIDIRSLTAGTYFLELKNEQEVSKLQFVKH